MVVALTAAVLTGFYAANVPLKVAFCARTGAGVGVSARPFDASGALRCARRRMGAKRRRIKKRPPLRLLADFGMRLLGGLRIERLEVAMEVGLSDAAATALLVGASRALLDAVSAATGARVRAQLRPDFERQCLQAEAAGIVSLRVGHIIRAACVAIFAYYGRNRHGQAPD